MTELTTQDFINIHHLIEREFKFRLGGGVRDPSTLDAIVNRPDYGFYCHDPHPDVFLKAASIFEGVTCWQPFVDGNKRTAIVITRVYLAEHGYSFFIPLSAVRFTVRIAISKPTTQDEIDKRLNRIARWLRRHSVRSNSSWASLAFDLYVGYPVRLLQFLAAHGLEVPMIWILSRWLAFDIYPEYVTDARKTLILFVQLASDSLIGKRRFNGIGRHLKDRLKEEGSPSPDET